MPASGVSVRGLRELQQAFAAAGKESSTLLRGGLREVAEPVRRDAETLAVQRIATIGTAWSQMRVGVTRKSVYVAPKQRGIKGRSSRHRPNLAGLLMDRAMQPALDRNAAGIEGGVERLLDKVADNFNRGKVI